MYFLNLMKNVKVFSLICCVILANYVTHCIEEIDCNGDCESFQCKSGSCINFDRACDGVKDCPDGSDETIECRNTPCDAPMVRCSYGACVTSRSNCAEVINNPAYQPTDAVSGSETSKFSPFSQKPSVQIPYQTFTTFLPSTRKNGVTVTQKVTNEEDHPTVPPTQSSISSPAFAFVIQVPNGTPGQIDKRPTSEEISPNFNTESESTPFPHTFSAHGQNNKNPKPTRLPGSFTTLPSSPQSSKNFYTKFSPDVSTEKIVNPPVTTETATPYVFYCIRFSSCDCFEDITTYSETFTALKAAGANPVVKIVSSDNINYIRVYNCNIINKNVKIVNQDKAPSNHRTTSRSRASSTSTKKTPTPTDVTNLECGSLGEPTSVSDNYVPWLVAIHELRVKSNNICWGTLTSPHTVVTAAHCFYNRQQDPSNFIIVIGKDLTSPEANEETRHYKIANITYLDNYFDESDSYYKGNIAILKISPKVEYSQYMKPACVDWQNKMKLNIEEGLQGLIPTWVITRLSLFGSEIQPQNYLYVSSKICRKLVGNDVITDDNFCIQLNSGSTIDDENRGMGYFLKAQNGNYHLFGVASNFFHLSNHPYIIVLTKLDKYRAKMKQIIEDIDKPRKFT